MTNAPRRPGPARTGGVYVDAGIFAPCVAFLGGGTLMTDGRIGVGWLSSEARVTENWPVSSPTMGCRRRQRVERVTVPVMHSALEESSVAPSVDFGAGGITGRLPLSGCCARRCQLDEPQHESVRDDHYCARESR